jgi:hypothetical protein
MTRGFTQTPLLDAVRKAINNGEEEIYVNYEITRYFDEGDVVVSLDDIPEEALQDEEELYEYFSQRAMENAADYVYEEFTVDITLRDETGRCL